MDSTPSSKFVTFNCKNVKRSVDGIQELCKTYDLIALQETWLTPDDLPYLNTISDEFSCTGTSAMNMAGGMVRGRNYGGTAILWRRSVFPNVIIVQCNNPRICAVKIMSHERSVLVVNVYMPCDKPENLTEFTNILGAVSAIIDSCNIDCVYILGDFNAHPGENFYKELLIFCEDQEWTCIDVEMLKGLPTFTFLCEVWGVTRWLDHVLVTKAAVKSVQKAYVNYNVHWSDHLPLSIACNLEISSPIVCESIFTPNKVLWGERNPEQIEVFCCESHEQLRLIQFPNELGVCADSTCNIEDHKPVIDKLYNNIVTALSKAAVLSKECTYYKKNKLVIGWNRHVRQAHINAREKFVTWLKHGKPNSGKFYTDMCESRKLFKNKLRWCQSNEEQIKMDTLASHHSKGDFRSFWKATKKLNVKPSVPVGVDGVNDAKDIANIFKDHFTVKSPLGPSRAVLSVESGMGLGIRFTAKEIDKVIGSMTRGKSPGHDGLSIEHLQNAGPHLPGLLAMLFNLCLSHAYMPNDMIKTLVIPIVKNKTGDLSDKNNYRPISLATVISKVFDSVLNSLLCKFIQPHDNQFGFRQGLSTETAILCVKHTVKYYTSRKTAVYAAFLDLSKAFDLVSYDILWKKLKSINLPPELINIFKFWYMNQVNNVKWAGGLSESYRLECGVRQGGLTSPILFNLYINDLIARLSESHIGCHIDEVCVNNISFADDMVLLSASPCGLNKLLSLCQTYAESHGLVYNVDKSEIMVFETRGRVTATVPAITLNHTQLRRVYKFKYLGHILSSDLKDEEDIERERRALSIRANMIARRFARCSKEVKISLFRAYCTSFYTCSLWATYSKKSYSALRVQFNNAFRVLMGLPKFCSASGMFAEARVDCFYASMRKRCASLVRRVRGSPNSILKMVASRLDCIYVNHCCAVSHGIVQQ
jgi:exonuclease III